MSERRASQEAAAAAEEAAKKEAQEKEEDFGSDWDTFMDGLDEEKGVKEKAKAELEKVKAEQEAVKVEAEKKEKAMLEKEAEDQEKSKRVAMAELARHGTRAKKEARRRPPSSGDGRSFSSGDRRGSGMIGDFGDTGPGLTWGDKDIRALGRTSYNVFDKYILGGPEFILQWLQGKAAKMSFDFLPWSNPEKVNMDPAIDPKFEKKKGK